MELRRAPANILAHFRQERIQQLLGDLEETFPGCTAMTEEERTRWAGAVLRRARPAVIRGRKWCPKHIGEYQGNYFDPAIGSPFTQGFDEEFRVVSACDACLDKEDGKQTALAKAERSRPPVPLDQLDIEPDEDEQEMEVY